MKHEKKGRIKKECRLSYIPILGVGLVNLHLLAVWLSLLKILGICLLLVVQFSTTTNRAPLNIKIIGQISFKIILLNIFQ